MLLKYVYPTHEYSKLKQYSKLDYLKKHKRIFIFFYPQQIVKICLQKWYNLFEMCFVTFSVYITSWRYS